VRTRTITEHDIERLGAREGVEDAVDVLFARRMTEDAETQRRHAVHTRRRDQAEAALLEGRDEAVDVGAVGPAEAHDAERRRGRELEGLAFLDTFEGVRGEVEGTIDRGPECTEPERPE